MNVNPGGAPQSKKKNTAVWVVVGVVVLVLGCCFTGVLAAIAFPNFIKYQGKSKQGECKSELRSIYQAEVVYFEEHKTYSTDFNQLGVTPVNNRYTYFIAPNVAKLPSRPEATAVSIDALPALAGGAVVGVEGTCPECTFTAACAGNLDKDETLDVWSISSAQRGDVPPGQINHDLDDIK